MNSVFLYALSITIIFTAIHYFFIGSKEVRLDDHNRAIQRFSLTERIFHWIRMLSFIISSILGIYLVFNDGDKSIGMLHSINGMIFSLITILTLVIWYKQFTFKAYDIEWLKHWGGYLSKGHGILPAGKYNAGQKIFFWLTTVFTLVLTITGIILIRGKTAQSGINEPILVSHGISALFVTILVIGHIYLSLAANPGTWKVLINGKVSGEWSNHHHPNWITDIPSKKPR